VGNGELAQPNQSLALEIEYPRSFQDGGTVRSSARLADICNNRPGPAPDLALLLPERIPTETMVLQLARHERFEHGLAYALVGLAGRDRNNLNTPEDVRIDGNLADHTNAKGLRQLTGINDSGYWAGRGSSGSPVFLQHGQQLAGILCRAELGTNQGDSPLREAFVVPASIIRPFLDDLIAKRDAMVVKIVAALDHSGELTKVASGGLERAIVVEIAKRLKPDEVLEFDQAVTALRSAVGIALDTIGRGERGNNQDDFVNAVLKCVAEQTKAGNFDSASKEVDSALAELDRREIEQRAALRQSRITLLEAGIEQDILRRDALAAAKRVDRIAATQGSNDLGQHLAFLQQRQRDFYVEGRDKGLNFSSEIAIEIARLRLDCAQDIDQRGAALNDLGRALRTLGERDSNTARLEEAIAVYREALREFARERVPLDWAMTQNNLGNALETLGERDSDTARLEEAVVAYREALREQTREGVPLKWAGTQNNLGTALQALGERDSDTARLEEAVVAYREALREQTREGVPLKWATTQNNLGTALQALGERDCDTARLEEAVVAYREALREQTRERVPLQWAMTQNNLGTVLQALGEGDCDTARLEEAVVAYREALREYTRERVPLDWAMTQNNLGTALQTLGECDSDTTRLQDAVVAYREALREYTRERVPLDWAMTQNNLGAVLQALSEHDSDTARLEEAVAAYREALREYTRERVPFDWAMTQNNLGAALLALGEHHSDTAGLEEAISAFRAAIQVLEHARDSQQVEETQENLARAEKLMASQRSDSSD
jgi:tetratricopeptide (TPR) repeat protein